MRDRSFCLIMGEFAVWQFVCKVICNMSKSIVTSMYLIEVKCLIIHIFTEIVRLNFHDFFLAQNMIVIIQICPTKNKSDQKTPVFCPRAQENFKCLKLNIFLPFHFTAKKWHQYLVVYFYRAHFFYKNKQLKCSSFIRTFSHTDIFISTYIYTSSFNSVNA